MIFVELSFQKKGAKVRLERREQCSDKQENTRDA